MSDPETPPASEDMLKVRVLSRRGRLGACTRKINEIKTLMSDAGNVDAVNESVQAFKEAVDEFRNAHKLVQELLSEEEKENDYDDWFEPRITNLNYFLNDVETWKKDIVQSTIRPSDSISNVSQKSKSSSSIRSSASRSSSVSSELKKAKAEQAAALARVAALKEKHALQMEEAKLKLKMEQIELEADLAASTAKIKTLQSDEVDQKPSLGDGMNEYYSSHQEPESIEGNVEFMQLGAIPKTPLQRTIFERCKSSPRSLSTAENKPQNKNPTESETEAATYDHNASQTVQDYPDVAVTAANENFNVVIQRQNDKAELIVSQQSLCYLREIFLCLMVTH
ncbi:uncharacterized protein LOC116723928 [Xiphophorus hellerii]|uniref:uncharacterized protein LOC116723928 n=1 Tax=Xiphophorus hellerii TaxID=8084 RepID=UPI0013B42FDF|nr:uncharacterized protein LOC116723928 [Xiphophorus hellerii]